MFGLFRKKSYVDLSCRKDIEGWVDDSLVLTEEDFSEKGIAKLQRGVDALRIGESIPFSIGKFTIKIPVGLVELVFTDLGLKETYKKEL